MAIRQKGRVRTLALWTFGRLCEFDWVAARVYSTFFCRHMSYRDFLLTTALVSVKCVYQRHGCPRYPAHSAVSVLFLLVELRESSLIDAVEVN